MLVLYRVDHSGNMRNGSNILTFFEEEGLTDAPSGVPLQVVDVAKQIMTETMQADDEVWLTKPYLRFFSCRHSEPRY